MQYFGSEGRKSVCRKENTELKKEVLQVAVRYGSVK
jgi:hypothetical protein